MVVGGCAWLPGGMHGEGEGMHGEGGVWQRGACVVKGSMRGKGGEIRRYDQ